MKTIVDYAQLVKNQHALNISLAPVEADPTASSKDYAIGQHFILDGELFKAKTAIALGDALVLDTNYEAAGSIEAQIETLDAENQTLTNQVKDMNNVYGAKNLLPTTQRIGGTASGVTFTVNDDDSITVNGTATSGIGQNVGVNKIFYGVIPKGKYLISCKKDKTTSVKAYYTLNNGSSAISVEEDSVLSLDSDSTLDMWIYVANTAVLNDVTFYPMIRLASITDDTYEPYAKTNQQLTEDTTALLDNVEVNGAVNFLPNTNVTQTKYGITYTVNDDGSITASGTATSVNGLYQDVTLPKGTYKLRGCPSGGSQNTYFLAITSLNIYDYGDGAIFTLSQETTLTVIIARINNTDTTYSGLTFKPMITVPSYNGPYVPYAKSNKELTEDFIPKVLTVTPNSSYVENNNLHATKYGQLVILSGYFRVYTEAARGEVLYTLPSSVGSFSGNTSGLALGNNGSAILLIIGDDNTLKVEASDGISTAWYSIMMVMLNKTENI